jgi:hypothetical protein
MNVRFSRLRKWSSCRALGLGVTVERLTIGTTTDDPRPIIDYVLTLTLLTRVITVRHARRVS